MEDESDCDCDILVQFMSFDELEFKRSISLRMSDLDWEWINKHLQLKIADEARLEKLTIKTYTSNSDPSKQEGKTYDLLIDDEKCLKDALKSIYKDMHQDSETGGKTDKFMHFLYTFA